MRKALLSLLILLAAVSVDGSFSSAQSNKQLLLRNPTMSKTHIVFVYAGDLWIAGREGGEASRLTTGVGAEDDPFFSPDGKLVAFTGQYDGNTDVYVVPATGGVPQRLTYHPSQDGVAGWTPDGKRVLMISGRNSQAPFPLPRLFTISTEGGLAEDLPLPMGSTGSFSPDGAMLVYQPTFQWQPDWKRYRGGQTTPIWIAKLSDSSVEKLPRDNSNDKNPMWIGDKVYFLSDRNGPVTLFSYDPKSKRVAELIKNAGAAGSEGFDIKSASAAGDAIVYEQFGEIKVFDLKSGKTRKVNITINGDLPSVRPRYEKVAGRIFSSAISPTGARAVFEARGEILSVPAEKGDARNLTNSPGVAERDPAWSPDGKWIAWFSDESGEYALHLRDQKGMGEVKKFKLEPTFYYSPRWSPDSKKIAFTDKRLNLWYLDIEKGQQVKVDTSGADGGNLSPDWSPDSRWISYTRMLKSWTHAVFVHSIEENKNHQVTDGLSDALHSQFDKNGKHLYFTASTDIGPTNGGLDMSSYPLRSTRSVYAVVLKKTDPSPLAPESDEEKIADEKKEGDKEKGGQGEEKKPDADKDEKKDDAAKPGDKPADKPAEKKEPPKVAIDFDNIGQRIVALPAPARNYVGLVAGKAGNLFIGEIPEVPFATEIPGAIIHKFDFEKRKLDKVLEAVMSFSVSANGEKMLFRQKPGWFIAATAAPVKPGEGKIKTEEMEVYIDPQAEWNQMYREVWRIERDFFYAPNYHGLDLKAAEKKYEAYLSGLAHREDLNYLFREMTGELSIGHMFIFGGDAPNAKPVPGGLLGADYKIENGRYRFAKVYNGENWNPKMLAPLTQPGVNVVAGEYLLAVNGRNLTASPAGGDNIYSFFESKAGKQVVIKVGPNADGSNSRDATVTPIADETGLRNLDWIEGNRRKVDQLSGGKLAYVHLPDTGLGGYTNFNRYYFAQLDKDGVVVDERFNGGGSAADYIVDHLRKPVMSYWAVREGMEGTTPFGVIPGPKVMITNEFAGSGGDLMPWMFRRMKIGPLVGKRTWGGLVGIGGYPVLVDGGYVTAPHFAFYNPEGQWEVENAGVAPDIEVELDPAAWRQGRDTQLEKAVETAMDLLKKNPVKRPQRPAYPNYHPARPAAASGNGSGN